MGPWHWHDPAGVTQTLGMEPQAWPGHGATASCWSGSVPHPRGGEEHPRRGRAAPPGGKEPKGASRGGAGTRNKPWDTAWLGGQEKALSHPLTLPGAEGMVQLLLAQAWAGSQVGPQARGQQGSRCPAKHRVLLAPRMETSWAPPHLCRPADPGKGILVLPTPMAAAQLDPPTLPHELVPV